MSDLSTTLAAAATEAQRLLAPVTDPDGDGVFVLSSTSYTGVMSIMEKVLVPTPHGYEEQRQIKITATRAQFSTAPTAVGRPKFTARGLTWTLTAVEPGPQFYTLTGVAGS